MRPTARQEDILTSELEDELIVYDMQNHKAHNLNRAAAAVWRLCDGRRTVADIAAALRRRSNLPAADEDFVWLALRRLGRARLLLDAPARTPRPASASRRRLLRRLGAAGAGALVLPLVTSVVVPTPVMALSCEIGCTPVSATVHPDDAGEGMGCGPVAAIDDLSTKVCSELCFVRNCPGFCPEEQLCGSIPPSVANPDNFETMETNMPCTGIGFNRIYIATLKVTTTFECNCTCKQAT